jgi:hypothetical protein
MWPALLGGAVADRVREADRHSAFSAVVYFAASRVCHQRPERSFATRGVSWPVCGRCAGLYLAAPIGAWWAVRRRLRSLRGGVVALLAAAAVPTAVTIVIEWIQPLGVDSIHRALAALPLGGVGAYAVTSAARGFADSDRIH